MKVPWPPNCIQDWSFKNLDSNQIPKKSRPQSHMPRREVVGVPVPNRLPHGPGQAVRVSVQGRNIIFSTFQVAFLEGYVKCMFTNFGG